MAGDSADEDAQRVPIRHPWWDDWRTSSAQENRRFYSGKSILADVVIGLGYVSQGVCTMCHRGKAPRKVKMQTPLVGEPWIRVSVDISGPFPRSSRSNQYILTVVDHFSKWAQSIPLRNHTVPTVARALVTHVFSLFGSPRQLLTDRGTEFESE